LHQIHNTLLLIALSQCGAVYTTYILAFPRLWRSGGNLLGLLVCLCLGTWAAFVSLLASHPPAQAAGNVICEFVTFLAVGLAIASCVAIDRCLVQNGGRAKAFAWAMQYTSLAICLAVAFLTVLPVYSTIAS